MDIYSYTPMMHLQQIQSQLTVITITKTVLVFFLSDRKDLIWIKTSLPKQTVKEEHVQLR